MDKETLLDFVIGFVFFALLVGGPWLLIKTNKRAKDALNKRSFGCCCLLLLLYVWLCILSVIMAVVFYFRHGYLPG
jgi:cytochrome bd-type quinol oxidase subunit 2